MFQRTVSATPQKLSRLNSLKDIYETLGILVPAKDIAEMIPSINDTSIVLIFAALYLRGWNISSYRRGTTPRRVPGHMRNESVRTRHSMKMQLVATFEP